MLSSPTNAALGDATATGTISDDDGDPTTPVPALPAAGAIALALLLLAGGLAMGVVSYLSDSTRATRHVGDGSEAK